MRSRPGRMMARQQQEKQRSQPVYVRCGGDGAAGHLLGRREQRRHRGSAFKREQRRGAGACFIGKELGDAEVQEFYLAVVADQHVRRLNVPVDDQVGMGLGDCTEHVQKQLASRLDSEHMLIAIFVDGLSLHILKNQVGFPLGSHAGINQFGDVRTSQLAQNGAFALEPLRRSARTHRKM